MQTNPYQAPAHQPGGGYGQMPVAPGGTYEFNQVENLTIGKLARRLRAWGVFALLTGVFGLLGLAVLFSVMDEFEKILRELPAEASRELPMDQLANFMPMILVGLAPVVFVNLIIGGLYWQSGSALKQVVNTQGNDISLMLEGVKKMGNAFMIEGIVSAISMVIGFAAGIVLAGGMSGGGSF